MKKFIVLNLLLCFAIGSAQSQHPAKLEFEYPLSEYKKYENVKQITNREKKWKTVYEFNPEGYLVKTSNSLKKTKRSETNFDYSLAGDSILRIKQNYLPSGREYEQEFHFDVRTAECKGYYHGGVSGENFVYEDGLLKSFLRISSGAGGVSVDTIKYTYNSNRLVTKRERASDSYTETVDFEYDEQGRNISRTTESFERENSGYPATYLGTIPYDHNAGNKYKENYSDFDRYGNWTKSYYDTSKGLVFKSKRKIEYFK